MTNTKPYLSPPSPRLLRLLPRMAEERGVSFVPPTTQSQALSEFGRLKAIPREGQEQRDRDRIAVVDAMRRSGGSSRVRPEEIAGFGSSARWTGAGEEYPETGPCQRCGLLTADSCRIGGRTRWQCSEFSACLRRRKASR
jgi:hypothetical protein